MFEKEILAALEKAGVKKPEIEVPPDRTLGDYAFACFALAKELRKPPQELAKGLAKKIKPPKGVERIVATGPYVNFFINKAAIAGEVLSRIAKEKDKFGQSRQGLGKTIVIDFSSPNIAKPFHYGHLRSTIIGNALYLLFTSQGYKVVRVNHLGDWGTQFGAVITAYLRWGEKARLDKDSIPYLVELYQRFHEKEDEDPALREEAKAWFKKLEDGDAQATKLWAKFKHLSLDEFRRIYEILGIEFDSYNGESFYNDKMEPTVGLIDKKGLTKLDHEALIVPVPGLDVPCMLKKSDGASTYALRDLAALKYRIDTYKPEKVLYVVGSEQSLHFRQVFGIAKQMAWKTEAMHIPFGLYLSPGGGKLSTRRGKTVLLDEVLKDVIALAKEQIEKKNPYLKNKDRVAKIIGVGAIIFGDLANDRIRDIVFDEHKFLDFEGDTGPYLQYTHARACSILRKAAKKKLKPSIKVDFSALKDKTEEELVMLLSNFHSKILEALAGYKPHILAQHLLLIGRAFNEFYHKLPVIQEKSKPKQKARLLLVDCTRHVLKAGLGLLGIVAPEEM